MPLGTACPVGDDKPDARVQLARMPFDLGHNVAQLAPALRPIAETGKVAAHLVRWSPNRALEQASDLILQDPVGRQSDRVKYSPSHPVRIGLRRVGRTRILTWPHF